MHRVADPVREALLRLEAEGIVRLLPEKGALVLPMSARADSEFHAALVDAAGNPVISSFGAGLRQRRRCTALAVIRLPPERMRRSISEHAAIVTALTGGERRASTALVATRARAARRTLPGLDAPDPGGPRHTGEGP